MATSKGDNTITKDEGVQGTTTVVIAVDRSKQAENALRWYVQGIHKEGNHVVLVHVPETPTVETSKGLRMPVGEWQKMKEKEKAETEEMVTKYKALLNSLDVTGSYKTVYGKPGEAIVTSAEELKADYIVMGTRGMGSVRRTILGSVSDYVIHHSHSSVIVCRQ